MRDVQAQQRGRGRVCFLCGVLALLTVCSVTAQDRPRLQLKPSSTHSALLLSSTFQSNSVLTLEASRNLGHWEAAGTFHDGVFDYPVLGTQSAEAHFYRAKLAPRTATNDWKNQLIYPDDPFRYAANPGDMEWTKFAILLSDPTRVYYQDSAKYPFHYDFAAERLPPFRGMDRQAFDAVSLYRTNQQVVLGAVLFPPDPRLSQYGVQLVGLDPFTPDEVARWYELVKASIYSSNPVKAFYMPTFEQSETTRTNSAAFDRLGVVLGSVEQWVTGNHCYAPGWALGQLKFFPAAEIATAFADGRLQTKDILLTDGVPAETPPVAGIISLRPSTPNSHTAILSRSFGIPFVYFPDAADQAWLQSLVGRKVILRANLAAYGTSEPTVFDVESTLTAESEAQLLAMKRAAPIQYAPKASFGALSAPTDSLTPADIRFFGGKAANYGFLRRFAPTYSVPAIAFSFDLWDGFMNQLLPGTNRTLREEIAARMAPYTNYPPDVVSLKQDLAGIRELITQTASFTASQQDAITNALVVFDPQRKIRFRSSTNVEDSEHFTGAGLYDSYSGCLLDDLDADTSGPSQCDPEEPKERGVFRALQRVYASFYNDNAFLERLRHGVIEAEVGMGILVHHSFPDDDELANGVADLTYRFSFGSTQVEGELVTQEGAESVTNPDGTSLPEIVNVDAFGDSVFLTLARYSSLLPLGAYVLTWEEDYRQFVKIFSAIAEGYREYYPTKASFTLDLEYKQDRNLGLVVKQVRELPASESGRVVPAFLVDAPCPLTVAQIEQSDVFANHRLKSIWDLHTRSMWLVSSNLAGGIYTQGTVDYLEQNIVTNLSGSLGTWPHASRSGDGTTNSWTTGSGSTLRKWELETTVTTEVAADQAPILAQGDFPRQLRVNYATPQPTFSLWSPNGGATTTTNETASLQPAPVLDSQCLPQERTFDRKGVSITTSFYWPKPPRGATAGYTAPLVCFVQTRISGLTAVPLTLTSYYSQTYRPGHHNFSEEFIFEPRLDPDLPEAARKELEAANIRLIYLQLGSEPATAKVLGLDQKFRDL